MKNKPDFSDAHWIHGSLRGGKQTMVPCPYFRKSFQVREGEILSAKLQVTALGLFRCEINGDRVGDSELDPGWTHYHKRVYVREWEVKDRIQAGENVLGAYLGDGWYCGFVSALGRQIYGEFPELLLGLELSFADGSQQKIVSDEGWKTSTGPILESDLLMGEAYDARREMPGWSSPNFDDSDWFPVRKGAGKSCELQFSPAPPIRSRECLTPVSVTRTMKNILRYDFGQNLVGRPRLRVTAPAGRHLILRYAEMRNPDGSLYTENYRSARSIDHYTCRGGGPEVWEPCFTFHGFQYAEINGAKEEDEIEFEAVVLHSDMARTGHFTCSNPLLNQLVQNTVWGQKGNFLDVPTDCPQRDERLGWTGDAQVFARTACFLFDARLFFHKWMRDVRDAMGSEGQMPEVCPSPGTVHAEPREAGPAWSDATVICPWTVYLCYGDTEILRDHYPAMRSWLNYIETHQQLNGIRNAPELKLWDGFGDWLALEYTGDNDRQGKTPKDLIGTAFFAHCLDLMSRTAEILGETEDSRKYRVRYKEVVQAFQNRYISPDGMVVGNTQTASVLALHFDLIPEEKQARAVEDLVANLHRRWVHLGTGFIGTPYILGVLEAHGHLDLAYRLLEQTDFPSWLFPVTLGATTIWERWDGWHPEKGFQNASMNSFNHYAYGSVVAWMVGTVAGLELDPASPGYRRILFRPRPGGSLTQADASLETVHGTASISWEIPDSGTLELCFTVPEGTEAEFDPPPGWSGDHEILHPGQHRRRLKRA
jgi:alpha-L-rhamnosidase